LLHSGFTFKELFKRFSLRHQNPLSVVKFQLVSERGLLY